MKEVKVLVTLGIPEDDDGIEGAPYAVRDALEESRLPLRGWNITGVTLCR